MRHLAQSARGMLDSRRLDEDLAKEVAQHPFGSAFGAVHSHEAKMFRTDGLHPLLDLTCGFANETPLRDSRFPFLALCDHLSVL
jgi:hypothetical protein